MAKKAVCLLMLMMILLGTSPPVFAAKFSLGDTVQVINCTVVGMPLRVRSSPSLSGGIIGSKNDGDRGMILTGPQSADGYNWWKVRWPDNLEGWSAEGDASDYYLTKVTIPPSTKFSIGDLVTVYGTGAYGLNVRNDPPYLTDTGTNVYDGKTGTVIGGPFYGIAISTYTPGFYHFWKINYGTITGWSAQEWLVEVPTYYADIYAHCNTDGADVGVAISMDGSPTGYVTPHRFTGLTGTHNFAVPGVDGSGHPFKNWNTGLASTTIPVSSTGTYTAYYQATVVPKTLSVYSSPSGVVFTADGSAHTTPWSTTYAKGTSVSLVMPSPYSNGDARYYWDKWNDGVTSSSRTVTLDSDMTVAAGYVGPYYELEITSLPISGIPLLIKDVSKSTPYSAWLYQGDYTVEMVQTFSGHNWLNWDDGSTNRVRTVSLTTSTMLTAVYSTAIPPTTISFVTHGSFLSIYTDWVDWLAMPTIQAKITDEISVPVKVVVVREGQLLAGAEVSIVPGLVLGTTDNQGSVEGRYPIPREPVEGDFQVAVWVKKDDLTISFGPYTIYSCHHRNTAYWHMTKDEAERYVSAAYMYHAAEPGMDVPDYKGIPIGLFMTVVDVIIQAQADLKIYTPTEGDLLTFDTFDFTANSVDTIYALSLSISRNGQTFYSETGFVDNYEVIRLWDLLRMARNSMVVHIGSPASFMVIDPNGLRAGRDPTTGKYFADFLIYGSAPDDPHQTIVIPAPIEGNYTILVIGTSNGTYELTVSKLNDTGYMTSDFIAQDIPMSTSVIHQFSIDWAALASGQDGVLIQVDANGDGLSEHNFTSDRELTQNEFLIQTGQNALYTFSIVWGEEAFTVSVESNSTVDSFAFSQPDKRIGFSFSGSADTIGFCNVTIPKALLYGPWTALIDGASALPIISENATHSCLYFTYAHSTHEVQIIGTVVIGPLPTYSLTITTTAGGTVDPLPGTYNYTASSSVQVTAMPSEGYSFDHWELDTINVGSANLYIVLMDGNHTLKAVFVYSNPQYVVGDINKDGIVDVFDLVSVVIAFGSTPSIPSWDARCDLNGDGVIDVFDLATVAMYFGRESTPP